MSSIRVELSGAKLSLLYPPDLNHRRHSISLHRRRCCAAVALSVGLRKVNSGLEGSCPYTRNGKAATRTCCMIVEQYDDKGHVDVNVDTVVKRPLGNFPPDIWGDRFDNFTLEDQLKMERYARLCETLKEDVRAMLLDPLSNLAKKMNLIDTVERLGFSYYYENEINGLLDRMFNHLSNNNFGPTGTLEDTAIQFRIFRQHGYNMPSGVFKMFINSEGKFMEALQSDEKGMISLFEAAQLRVHGEDILEEALGFTTNFLRSIANFSNRVSLALQQPLHSDIPRMQIRKNISLYMEDESHNKKLLQLGKIEFNRVQLLHRQELSQIQKWWKDYDFVRKFPYMKHRSVECHFSSIAMCYQPQYSFARMLCARIFILGTLLDDTSDAYGTFEDIQQLTNAFKRWNLNSMEQLSADYLKEVYECVINTLDELTEELTTRGKPYARHYLKEQFQTMSRNHLLEAEWVEKKYPPTFDEYMVARRVTILLRLGATATLLGMEDVREVKPLEELLQADLKVQIAGETISGLLDDLVTGEAELARQGRNVTSIECYMRDYNTSREETLEVFKEMIEDSWKDMNNERFLINDTDLSAQRLFDQIMNFSRGATVVFKIQDGFTLPIEKDIIETYVEPFFV